MWRDRLDAFWDGRHALVLGFFDEETMAAQALRPEIVVASARDEALEDEPTLVDLVDAKRWRSGLYAVELPQDHLFVSLRSPDGAELRLALTGEKATPVGGEWRLLLAEHPNGSAQVAPAFRAASLSTRGDLERLSHDQIARSGPKLIWALSQRRSVERGGDSVILARLWPTQRIFPAQQSRLVIEALELQIERKFVPLKAPFAIMEQWLQENGAPCATLRLRFPSLDLSEAFLSRTAVVLVMQQRRRFREWARQQRQVGGAIADLLTCEDIRLATRRDEESLDAVESGKPIVVQNLLKLVAKGGTPFDGVAVRRRPDAGVAGGGVVVDIDFYAAVLGDDIGLVSTSADAGDFEVVPADPGGVRYARLFRFGFDGLEPRAIEDDDLLLDEILRLAAEAERGSTGMPPRSDADKVSSVQGRREKLLAGLNGALASAGFAGRFDSAKMWDVFEPILLASFVALVTEVTPVARAFLKKLGGYEGYRMDPNLVQALARQLEVAPWQEGASRQRRTEAKSLVYRYAAACGVPGVVVPGADLPAQVEAWRLLMQGPTAKHLVAARIALDGSEALPEKVERATDLLANEAMVERAAIYCDDWGYAEKAAALRAYLERRQAEEWTPLSEAEFLAGVVEEADAYWREVGAGRAAAVAAPEPPPPPKPAGLLAAVRSFFTRESSKPTHS